MPKERVYWVDQGKALGLLVVMLVHSPIPLVLEHYLRSFSMPRFFIIAGLFLNLAVPFSQYVKSKFIRLVIPYFGFAFLSYFVWLGYRQFASTPDAAADPLNTLLWLFYANGGGNLVFNRPLWFLPCLFTTLILVYFLVRIPKPYIYPALAIFAVLGYWIMNHHGFRPPWSLDLALTTATLTALGVTCKDYLLNSQPLNWGWLVFWFVISLLTAMSNDFVKLSAAEVGNFFLFYISAFAGTIFTLELTKKLPYNRALSYLGQRTLPIYATHIIVYMFLYEGFQQIHTFLPETYTQTVCFKLIELVGFLSLGLALPLLGVRLYDKLKQKMGERVNTAISQWVTKSEIKETCKMS